MSLLTPSRSNQCSGHLYILLCLTPNDFTRQWGTCWTGKGFNNVKNYVPINNVTNYVPINNVKNYVPINNVKNYVPINPFPFE